jgi:hypothetical protein
MLGSAMGTKPYTNTKRNLPKLGNSAKSVRRYLSAVARAVEDGSISANQAKECTSAAKGVLRAVEIETKAAELAEWRDLVERAEAVAKAGEAHEVESRERMDEADADVG